MFKIQESRANTFAIQACKLRTHANVARHSESLTTAVQPATAQ